MVFVEKRVGTPSLGYGILPGRPVLGDAVCDDLELDEERKLAVRE